MRPGMIGLSSAPRGQETFVNPNPPVFTPGNPPNPVQSLAFEHVATSTDAAGRSTAWGRSLQGLIGYDGKVFGGYGDWVANTGAVKVWQFDPGTGLLTYTGYTATTEAIQLTRELSTGLYAPFIDPTDDQARLAHYAAGGAWANVNIGSNPDIFDVYHVFDVAEWGGHLYACGSAAGADPSVVWRSTNGGTNWSVLQRFHGLRAYWLLSTPTYLAVSDVQDRWWKWDGFSWTQDLTLGIPWAANYVTYLDGICAMSPHDQHSGNTITVHIGSNTYPSLCMGFGNDRLWMVGSGTLSSFTGAGIIDTWDHTLVSASGVKPSGVCELGGYLYVGDTAGKLWKSTTTV